MGRIDNIVQKHVDEHIEQKLNVLASRIEKLSCRIEKLEKSFKELRSEITEIRKEWYKYKLGLWWL